jgi:hypothetical protein
MSTQTTTTTTTVVAAARRIAELHDDVPFTFALIWALGSAAALGRTPPGGWTATSNLTLNERDALCGLYASTGGEVIVTTTGTRRCYTHEIAALLRDRPTVNTPPAERQAWLARKHQLVAAVEHAVEQAEANR